MPKAKYMKPKVLGWLTVDSDISCTMKGPLIFNTELLCRTFASSKHRKVIVRRICDE